MKWPWVRRSKLEQVECLSRRTASDLSLLRWWLEHAGIEVPGGNEILMLMYSEVAASKMPAVLQNITAGPSTLEALEKRGRIKKGRECHS